MNSLDTFQLNYDWFLKSTLLILSINLNDKLNFKSFLNQFVEFLVLRLKTSDNRSWFITSKTIYCQI